MSRVLIVMTVWLFLSCAQAQTRPEVCVDPLSAKFVIAFVQDTMGDDYRVAQVEAVKKRLLRYPNITFVHSDAKGSSAMMIRQIEDFIAMKVDLIMTSPNNEIALAPVIEKAHENNIPVILIGRSVKSDKYTLIIHADNIMIATEAAKYMAKKMHFKGTILMLKGVEETDVTRYRSDSFLGVMRQYKGIKVVTKTANHLRRDAIMAMEEILDGTQKVDAVYSHGDSMLSGVRTVLRHRGIDPSSLLMVGIDYTAEAREAIRNDTQDSTFLYPLCGEEAADAAVDILFGRKVPKEIVVGTKHITKENVDAVAPIF